MLAQLWAVGVEGVATVDPVTNGSGVICEVTVANSTAIAVAVATTDSVPQKGRRQRFVIQSNLVCVPGGIVCVREAPLFISHYEVQRRKDGA